MHSKIDTEEKKKDFPLKFLFRCKKDGLQSHKFFCVWKKRVPATARVARLFVFQTKSPNLGKFRRAFGMKNVGMYFLWPFGI
jgi:hypothetical protein